MKGRSLTKKQLDKAIEVISNQPPREYGIFLFGKLERGIKDAFVNPVTGELVIVAKDLTTF